MTEQEIRALVRDAIARHHGASAPHAAGPAHQGAAAHGLRQHPSHALYVLPAGGDSDGPCVIEPAVRCNHCGYCKTHGY